jgi:hypothetical protein
MYNKTERNGNRTEQKGIEWGYTRMEIQLNEHITEWNRSQQSRAEQDRQQHMTDQNKT